MEYGAATFINKDTGKVITTLNSVSPAEIEVSSNYRIPRAYTLRNIEGNEELYSQLVNYIGKTLRLESDQINGSFNISLDGEDIVLKEVIS
jgi:uncharacterized membrane protein YukC